MVVTKLQSSNNETKPDTAHPYNFSNAEIADVLEQVADLLEAQEANPFRVRAYWEGAQTIRQQKTPVVDLLLADGVAGLEQLPGIGKSLAGSIEELAYTGRLRSLERLQGEVTPEDLFATIPGIGEELACHIHRELGIETLEELELTAHDGRLETVKGFGHRRVRLVRDALASMLSRSSRRHARLIEHQDAVRHKPIPLHPPVSLLLAVDTRYRRLASAGQLRTIAPRRFNPEGKSWLPIMHWEQDSWTFTALFSNTARAHQLNKTRDWVVIFYERAGREGQCTVVTETRGSLVGQRVVRGREIECKPISR
ncbi:MAG: helix-hairpin-helix domain-containing protein [Synechococcus sp.]